MKQGNSQSYLDLSVLPSLRTCVLTTRPVVVFSENLDAVVWANAAGAQLFGGTGLADLLTMRISSENSLIRQLGNAVGQMSESASITRGIRINRSLRSQMLQFEIERLELPEERLGYKITHLVDTGDDTAREHKIAQLAINSLEGFADAAAISDDVGLPVFSSEGFENLGPDENSLAELIAELKSEEDRLIKRPIRSAEGIPVAIGLARLTEDPGRNLVVIARVSEDQDEVLSEITPLEADSIPVPGLTEKQLPQTAGPEDIPQDLDLVEDQLNVKAEPEIQNLQEDSKTEELSASETAKKTDIAEMDSISSAITPEQSEKTSASSNSGDSVRFAWTVDENSKFTFVSEELADAVGSLPADIVGLHWRDIADALGFDKDNVIASLLEQKDTWSGKIVLWPVGDTGKVVPVNLAALPVFGPDRNFEGFRGYGKILLADLQYDPGSTGKKLETAGPNAEGKPDKNADYDDEPEIKFAQQIVEDEDQQTNEGDEAIHPSNIVPFARTKEDDPRESLSKTERNALKAVREHLQGKPEDDADDEQPEGRAEKQVDTSLLDKLPVAVIVYRDGKTLYANPPLLEACGYSSLEELVKAGGISSLLDSDDGNGQFIKRSDGNRIRIDAVLHTVPWVGEKALLLLFSAPHDTPPDILELTRVSEVQSILDTTADGIILMDEEGKIISINPSAEALFGLDFDAAIDRDLEYLFAEESKPVIRQYVESIITPGFDSLINDGEEAIAREYGGGMIPVFLTIARMEQTGKLCAVIRDITSWKKTEEELIQSKRKAEKISEQKSEFLAQVSHEIRTPLNAIIGFSDVMIEERFGPIENERYREYLRDIRRSGVHVLEIINELLDLSKIEAGKLDLTFEAVNLNELIAETVALLQPQANANRTIIRTSLSRAVPKVVADPRSIRQVILNLVSNAIKYSEANSQVIVSTVYETNGEVALRVRDTGNGMTENEIEMAMKPFRQVHAVEENSPEGTGLGLPLTKALVEANRAFFELESEPGNGTIAHVQFPTQRVLAD
ncbi:MAG: PAS domain S-box protein [Rhizobiaceae bacterium]